MGRNLEGIVSLKDSPSDSILICEGLRVASERLTIRFRLMLEVWERVMRRLEKFELACGKHCLYVGTKRF